MRFAVNGFIFVGCSITKISGDVNDLGVRFGLLEQVLDEGSGFSVGKGRENCGLAF